MQFQKASWCDSEDKITVKKHSGTLTFPIYYLKQLVIKVSINTEALVSDLLDLVRRKLSYQFENIVGLSSCDGLEIVDYTLTLPNYPVWNYRNHEPFRLLLEEVVCDDTTPMLADFTFLKCIGNGASSQVYLVRHNSNGQLYALKQIGKEYFKDFKRMEQVLREKKIMTDIVADLTFVIKLYCSFESCYFLNFLFEFYPGGELFYHLRQAKFTEDQAKLCFAEVLLTFEALHARNTIYRDLKPENIMVDFHGHLRLGDFGLCKINLAQDDVTYSHYGSEDYMAPEIKQTEGYSYSADFYTMGALIHEMVLGVPPYYEGNPNLQFPKSTSEDFQEIVTKLIDKDPKKRVSNYNQLRRLRWLRKIDWNKVEMKQYKMPIRIKPYNNYTHQEFKAVTIDNQELKKEEKYDRLFDMFFYLSDDKNGIGIYYPARSCLKMLKKPKTKTTKCKDKSNSKSSKSNTRKAKEEEVQQPLMKRKSVKRDTIYTSAVQQASPKPDRKTTSKSRAKLQPVSQLVITKNKLPSTPAGIKFNKLVLAKSEKNLHENLASSKSHYPRATNKMHKNHADTLEESSTSQQNLQGSSLHVHPQGSPQGSELYVNQVHGNQVQMPQPARNQTQDSPVNYNIRPVANSYHANYKKF